MSSSRLIYPSPSRRRNLLESNLSHKYNSSGSNPFNSHHLSLFSSSHNKLPSDLSKMLLLSLLPSLCSITDLPNLNHSKCTM
jgi:hypothetical protein